MTRTCEKCGARLEGFNTDDVYPHRVHKKWMCDAAIMDKHAQHMVDFVCKEIVKTLRDKGHEEAADIVENRKKRV